MSRANGLPAVFCVIGTKDSGKTRLTVALVQELSRRGYRVMSAKHGHGFRLDTPGTDSWKHRHQGGAERVALVGPDEFAVVGSWGPEGEPPLAHVVERFLQDADVVIAEGFKTEPFPKIEVFRAATGSVPLMRSHVPTGPPPPGHRVTKATGPFLALVTDAPDRVSGVPVFDIEAPDTIAKLSDLVERMLPALPRRHGSRL